MTYVDPTSYWKYIMETGKALRDILGVEYPPQKSRKDVIECECRDITQEEENEQKSLEEGD